MNKEERKKNRVSVKIEENNIGITIATWCQVSDGFFVIKQAVADINCEHFTNGHGMENTIYMSDISLLYL